MSITSEAQRREESGRRIYHVRYHVHGWTQAELASQIGAHRRTVGAWETGQQEPSPRMLRKLSEVLGMPISYLSAFDLDQEGSNGKG